MNFNNPVGDTYEYGYDAKFLGFAYFVSNWEIKSLDLHGIIMRGKFKNFYRDEGLVPEFYEEDLWITTRAPSGFRILKLDPAPGVSEYQMYGKLTTRAHKVFTKDWPKGLGQDEDGDWPMSPCHKYRVAVHDFQDFTWIKIQQYDIPVRAFEKMLETAHLQYTIDTGWRDPKWKV